MRPLLVVDAAHPLDVMAALKDAVIDGGPAVLPRLGGAKDVLTAPYEVEPEVAIVIETSGTTGKPKRVWLSADALLSSARGHLESLGGDGVWWLVVPTSYIAGVQVLTRSILAGTQPIVATPGPFGPDRLLDALEELSEAKKSSRLYSAMVPAQLARLVDAAENDPRVLAGLRLFDAILVGGQAIPQPLVTRAEQLGVRVIRTYGSAETSGGCVWNGRPLPGVVVSDMDGRLAIHGPHLAGGYLDDPALSSRHFIDKDGTRWFVTDDQGVIHPDGSIAIVGRVDDVIVSGGKKVSLAEVERILVDEGGFQGIVVVPGTHEEWGQVPVIVSPAGIDLDRAKQLVGHILGVHARPDRVVTLNPIPVLASGKPDRVAIGRLVSP